MARCLQCVVSNSNSPWLKRIVLGPSTVSVEGPRTPAFNVNALYTHADSSSSAHSSPPPHSSLSLSLSLLLLISLSLSLSLSLARSLALSLSRARARALSLSPVRWARTAHGTALRYQTNCFSLLPLYAVSFTCAYVRYAQACPVSKKTNVEAKETY